MMKQALLTAIGGFIGAAAGTWVSMRLAQGCPVWPW